jgi:hypothetical protein
MTTLDVLRDARAIIEDPARWWQGSAANETCTRFCAMGAIRIGLGRWDDVGTAAWEALDAASGDLHGYALSLVSRVNDQVGHEAVLRVYDRAIAVEEAKAAEQHPGDPLPALPDTERVAVAR